MTFFDSMQNELNNTKTLTTNGAVAYATSGKRLLDFNFAVSAMRGLSAEEIKDLYGKVFFEDKLTAMEYLFYLGDVREGLGERKAFRAGLSYLANNQPEIANAVMELVPQYNRWDSILGFLDVWATRDAAVNLIRLQLEEDVANMNTGKPISLCAKWCPSINSSSKKTKQYGRIICNELGWSEKKYRKTLSALRLYSNVVEVKMSAKQWGDINYEAVPSKANLKYSGAFLKNDETRRKEYLESLKKGDAKINAGTLNPHEICYKYRTNQKYNGIEVDDTLEALWKALPDMTVGNTLVVRDGSGSMTWGDRMGAGAKPLDVATALAIYMADHNSAEWKDKFITFSDNPKIVDLSNCETLAGKVWLSLHENDYENTDIYKTMMLILKTAKRNHTAPEDMPQNIVIVSDMQFDGWRFNLNEALFDEIARKYAENGYNLPRMIFWNVNGNISRTIPMQRNELGVILCSGFSVQIMDMFMSCEVDPCKVLIEVLKGERYDAVRKAVATLV